MHGRQAGAAAGQVPTTAAAQVQLQYSPREGTILAYMPTTRAVPDGVSVPRTTNSTVQGTQVVTIKLWYTRHQHESAVREVC